MSNIKPLPQSLIHKIAAGEVIERPASVIKELVENSIDAHAKHIVIEVEEGGTKRICIKDDGDGMDEQDAKNSYKLHTTSKISSLEDLNSLFTLGFRGEALASICSVAEVTIHTKDSSGKATELIVENSELTSTKHPARSKGTTIIVQDLFRHLPARKKFLRTPTTEFRYVHIEFLKIALAHPEIAFELWHNGKEHTTLSPTSWKERISELYPQFEVSDLLHIAYESPSIEFTGYIGHPNTLTKDRSKQFTFINDRAVFDKSVVRAVKDGYKSTIPSDRNPAFFIKISINPEHVDVNIHPRKLEVKIDNDGDLFRAVRSAVHSSLEKRIQEDLNSKLGEHKAHYTETYTDTSRPYIKVTPTDFDTKPNIKSPKNYSLSDLKPQNSYKTPAATTKNSMLFTQSLLADESESLPSKAFQLFRTYIVFEKNNEVHIIDQHAADERIHFERIQKDMSEKKMITRQDLLLPITLEYSQDEIAIITEHIEDLLQFGLDIDIFGKKSIKINAIPHFAREIHYKDLLNEIISTYKEREELSIDKIQESIAASLACHGSIRAGKHLTDSEIQKLIKDLFDCDLPYSCPHGRPIIWTLQRKDFEKKFERIKPS